MLLFAGALAGSVVGGALKDVLPIAAQSVAVGISPPFSLDLAVLTIVLGGTLAVNLGGVLGIILALLLYRRL